MNAQRRRVLQALAGTLLTPDWLLAQERYESIPPGPDAIGKRYMGRDIAAVMDWHGAAWLERTSREREERPDLLLSELQLRPGMDVADIGAGTGYHARRMARAVAPGGTVYAVDVQPEMLRMLEHLAREDRLDNFRVVAATQRNAQLRPQSLDLALMVDTYHELAYPFEVVDSIVRALRPGGRLVLVEYRAEDPKVNIRPLHKMSEAQVRKEMAVHPLRWERTVGSLPRQHLIVFRKALRH